MDGGRRVFHAESNLVRTTAKTKNIVLRTMKLKTTNSLNRAEC